MFESGRAAIRLDADFVVVLNYFGLPRFDVSDCKGKQSRWSEY